MKKYKFETKQSCNLTILEIVKFFKNFFMDTKGPIRSASEGNHYVYVIVVYFSNYIVTVPTLKIIAHYALVSII